jgi:hypothetical protein
VYAYEYNFLHAVTIGGIPIFLKSLIACKKWFQLFLGHGRVPLTGLMQGYLAPGLFK